MFVKKTKNALNNIFLPVLIFIKTFEWFINQKHTDKTDELTFAKLAIICVICVPNLFYSNLL